MRTIIFIFFVALLFSSCTVVKQQSLLGEFKGPTPGMGSFVPPGEMTLSLKADKTFDLHWLNVNYVGKWELLDKNHTLLKFDEITDPSILLRSGTLSDEERDIRFVNKNKIKIYNYVLKREQ